MEAARTCASLAPMIDTPRLHLRPHRAEDLEPYRVIWAPPPEPGNPAGFALNEEEAWYRLLRFVGHWAHFNYGLFVVEHRETGRLIGEAGYAHFHRGIGPRFDDAPEAAWRILPEFRGSGFATEAMRAASQWLDPKRVAPRTVCIIDPANAASIKVAGRLGFREYGRTQYKQSPVILFERDSA